MNFYLLLTYSLILLLLCLKTFKNRMISTNGLILFVYALASVTSMLYYDGIYDAARYDMSSFFFPLLYLLTCLLISLWPVRLFDKKKNLKLPQQSVVEFFIWLFIVSTFLGSLITPMNFSANMIALVVNSDYGLDAYHQMAEAAYTTGMSVSNIPMIISNSLFSFIALLLFVYLTYPRKKNWLLILLGIFILYCVMKSLVGGERGALVNRGLIVLVAFICMKPYLQSSLVNKIWKIIIVCGIVITIPFMALTISRFGETDLGVSDSIISYAGQSTVNFSTYAFDNNGIRYGDRVFPLFKRILGFENVPHNFMERRAKYPNLKINDEVFSTYIGDFVLDFGPWFAMLIIIFIAFCLVLIVKNKNQLPFYNFIFLYLWMCVLVQGVSLFQFADTSNVVLIMYFLIYLFIKYIKFTPQKV